MLTGLLDETDLLRKLEQHWPRGFFYFEFPVQLLSPLVTSPLFTGTDQLLTTFRGPLQSWTGDNRVLSRPLDPALARETFRRGKTTLKLENLHDSIPALNQFMQSIGRAMRTRMNRTYCNAYLSPRGKHTSLHFDEHEVLILQLRGSKRWKIAPNLSIESPSFGYNGNSLDESCRHLLKQPLPDTMPENCRRYTLSPGSLLFLPRGTWHETDAVTESLGLTFSFDCKTRLDIANDLIRQALIREPQWRRVSARSIRNGENDDLSEIIEIDSLLRKLGSKVSAEGIQALLD